MRKDGNMAMKMEMEMKMKPIMEMKMKTKTAGTMRLVCLGCVFACWRFGFFFCLFSFSFLFGFVWFFV